MKRYREHDKNFLNPIRAQELGALDNNETLQQHPEGGTDCYFHTMLREDSERLHCYEGQSQHELRLL